MSNCFSSYKSYHLASDNIVTVLQALLRWRGFQVFRASQEQSANEDDLAGICRILHRHLA